MEEKTQPSIWDRIANNVANAVQPLPPPHELTPEERLQARKSIEDTFNGKK